MKNIYILMESLRILSKRKRRLFFVAFPKAPWLKHAYDTVATVHRYWGIITNAEQREIRK